jgi:phage terminase small subunit
MREADRDTLTPKQARFVTEYLVDLNATAAYRRAGYKVKSDEVASAASARLLGNVKVAAAVAAGQAERSERTKVTADQVVRELARLAFSDPRQVMEWGPGGVKLRDSSELTDDAAALVESVSETTTVGGGSLKVKLHSKVAALRMLAEHLGMLKVPVELGTPVALQVVHEIVRAAHAHGDDKPPADGH